MRPQKQENQRNRQQRNDQVKKGVNRVELYDHHERGNHRNAGRYVEQHIHALFPSFSKAFASLTGQAQGKRL